MKFVTTKAVLYPETLEAPDVERQRKTKCDKLEAKAQCRKLEMCIRNISNCIS